MSPLAERQAEAWKPPESKSRSSSNDRVADAYVQATRPKASAPDLLSGFQHPVLGPARFPFGGVPPAVRHTTTTASMKRDGPDRIRFCLVIFLSAAWPSVLKD